MSSYLSCRILGQKLLACLLDSRKPYPIIQDATTVLISQASQPLLGGGYALCGLSVHIWVEATSFQATQAIALSQPCASMILVLLTLELLNRGHQVRLCLSGAHIVPRRDLIQL